MLLIEYYRIFCSLPFSVSLVSNPDFKAGVTALSNLLQIQRHDDYLVMLKVRVAQRFSTGGLRLLID